MTETIQTDSIQQTSSISEATPQRFQCRHIHTEGRRCGSASLRGEEFCYFHHTSRKPVANPRTRRSRQATFDLPLPEDRGAIQLSIGEVLRRIASNQIDPRRAGILLYGLQIASLNLPNRHAPTPVEATIEEIITDPHLGDLAPRTEILDAEAPRTNSLIAKLLEAIRIGREEMPAESKAEPATLPTLNASAAIHAEPGKHPRPQTCPQTCPQICLGSRIRRGSSRTFLVPGLVPTSARPSGPRAPRITRSPAPAPASSPASPP